MRLRARVAVNGAFVLLSNRDHCTVDTLQLGQDEDLQRDIHRRHDRAIALEHHRIGRQLAPRSNCQIRGVVHDVGGKVEVVKINLRHSRKALSPTR